MNTLFYNGYHAEIDINIEENVLHGKIAGITDLVIFEGRTLTELRAAFEKAVDDYTQTCRELNKPEIKYCECGVPQSQHNEECGWKNANVIYAPFEYKNLIGKLPEEEVELRWLASKSPNAGKLMCFLANNLVRQGAFKTGS